MVSYSLSLKALLTCLDAVSASVVGCDTYAITTDADGSNLKIDTITLNGLGDDSNQTMRNFAITDDYVVFVPGNAIRGGSVYRLTDWPGKTVAAADCLVPGIGEIIGGSQREERLDLLEARIKDLGMNPEQYKYYLDLRRYGSCKHAGYGLGFERLVMYLTGVGNIRDVLPHPRTVGNADF